MDKMGDMGIRLLLSAFSAFKIAKRSDWHPEVYQIRITVKLGLNCSTKNLSVTEKIQRGTVVRYFFRLKSARVHKQVETAVWDWGNV